MDLQEAIKGRRSVRSFQPKEVEPEKLERILESVLYAPTACDRQQWCVIVVESSLTRIIHEGAAHFIRDAPLGLLVCYDSQTDNTEWEDDIISGALAIQNMVLTAHELGLGSCIVCHLPPKKWMRQHFHLPTSMNPIAYVCIGYPSQPHPPKKVNLDRIKYLGDHSIAHYERYTGWDADTNVWNPGLALKRLGRRIYYLLPWREYLKPLVDKMFEKKFEGST